MDIIIEAIKNPTEIEIAHLPIQKVESRPPKNINPINSPPLLLGKPRLSASTPQTNGEQRAAKTCSVLSVYCT